MALPPEKVSEMKQIIHSQMSQKDIQSEINRTIDELRCEDSPDLVDQNLVLHRLLEKGVVSDIMSELNGFGSTPPQPQRAIGQVGSQQRLIGQAGDVAEEQKIAASIDPNRRYLYLSILSGRAFLGHLDDNSFNAKSTFTLHVLFREQRFKSRAVPCACDPDIRESFLLELHKGAGAMLDAAGLLSLCDPIHLVLIRTDSAGDVTLVSSNFYEWRKVLATKDGRQRSSIELLGTGKENKVPVGLLEVQLELFPRINQPITEEVVATQLSMELGRQAEKERLFLLYAKNWWKEYKQIRETHGDRMVKIFAQDENASQRPVCSYVRPLRCGRLLDTPRQAARFVSLIGQEKVATVGGGEKPEQWTTMHACLCRNKGDTEDHAVLLCSLLLGFSLDAYVCVGRNSRGSVVAWVMSISTDMTVTFWDPLQAHRYIHHPINPNDPPLSKQNRPKYPYKTIGCLFNHSCFYANCQPTDTVDTCRFDLDNGSLWKPMSEEAIQSVCGIGMSPLWPAFPPLSPNSMDPSVVSNDLEQQLRDLVANHRADADLNTQWDDQLSYLLTQCLSSYEIERVTGISAGNEEFQDCMHRYVPPGQTFKGYPIMVPHINARKALNACLRSAVCTEIINCRGDHVRLAVRVRVFTYPENALATWIMFACVNMGEYLPEAVCISRGRMPREIHTADWLRKNNIPYSHLK